MPGEFIVMFHKSLDVREWSVEYGWSTSRHCLQGRTFTCSVPLRRRHRPKTGKFFARFVKTRGLKQPNSTIPSKTAKRCRTIRNWVSSGIHVENGDHDIDSDLAWDITTGGVAADGSRIVVAVLEGGAPTTTTWTSSTTTG